MARLANYLHSPKHSNFLQLPPVKTFCLHWSMETADQHQHIFQRGNNNHQFRVKHNIYRPFTYLLKKEKKNSPFYSFLFLRLLSGGKVLELRKIGDLLGSQKKDFDFTWGNHLVTDGQTFMSFQVTTFLLISLFCSTFFLSSASLLKLVLFNFLIWFNRWA